MRLLTLSLAVALLLGTTPAHAAEEKVKMDEQTKKAVGNALDWLKSHQNRDGSWGNSAVTSFAILAFMANGHVPNQGLYGPEVAKGVRNLLAIAREDGYLAGGGNMYCHGMAALALTQVWGMTGDEEVKKVLKKSIDLIVKTQNGEGGWRYEPSPTGADISVTIMQVMALRGAKDSGLHVPDETMKRALKYINRCHDPRSGGYRYMPYSAGPGYARTAAGVCVLQLCGEYEAREIEAAVRFLELQGDDRQHYWYGHYYAAHALNQVGGKKWEDYYSRMKAKLLATQRTSGEWLERMEAHNGPSYQTAIAVLILSVPSHYLPIYQR
jgi:squalene cyclase